MQPRTVVQVRALVQLRTSALRGPARSRAVAGLLALPLIAVAAVVAGSLLPAAGRTDARVLMPTALLGFALTVVLSAGAQSPRALLPRAQALAFPVTPAADYLGGLLLAPLNVAWVTPVAALLALATWGFTDAGAGAVPTGLLLTAVWVLAATMLAQLVGAGVELARTTGSGPWTLRALAAAGVAGGVVVTVTGRFATALDHLPTTRLVTAAVTAAGGDPWPLARVLVVLTAAGVACHLAGVRLTGALLRRSPRDQALVESRHYPARAQAPTGLRAALRIDRAGVWRSAPLRRGIATLVAVPAVAAATAGLDRAMSVLLPGLVASGAGLLFGVNALALDGPGSMWRDSLPAAPRTLLLARLLVVTEICAGSALLAAVIGSARASGPVSVTAVVGVAGAVIATSAQVVARCARWSVDRPYAAPLRDTRDQPAPPAAMAGYSARLAISTTLCGLAFSLFVRHGLTLPAVVLTLLVTAGAARTVLAALRRWDDPAVRSRVIATVSAG